MSEPAAVKQTAVKHAWIKSVASIFFLGAIATVGGVGQAFADGISAAPCQLAAGQQTCTTQVSWQSSSAAAQVYVIDPLTGGAQLWAASGTSGNQAWSYTIAWPGYDFEVRVNNVRTATTRVYAKRLRDVALAGGSNYFFHQVDYTSDPKGNWTPYTALANIGQPAALASIRSQLRAMYNAGQRSLRIPVWFLTEGAIGGASNGYACGRSLTPNDGFTLEANCRNNLATLLAEIRAVGFEHVIVGLFPQWYNDPWVCEIVPGGQWPNRAADNYGVIVDLRRVARASGLKYMIDLGNEDIPQTGRDACHMSYAQSTWTRYVNDFGVGDTVGFSIALDSRWAVQNRFGLIDQVYGATLPPALDLHIYGDSTGDTDAAIFHATYSLHNQMSAAVRARPWIIGESYFNDNRAAIDLGTSRIMTGKQVLFLTQWPLQRSNGSTPSALAPFDRYQDYGF